MQSTVHLRVQGHSFGFIAIVVNAKHFGVIVLGVVFQLFVALIEAILAIPKHIVMAGQVVIGTPCEGVPFGGATTQQHGGHGEDKKYFIFSKHVEIVLMGFLIPELSHSKHERVR